MVFKCDGGDMS